MSLHDLMAFAVLAHRCFDGVYKRAHWVMVQDLNLFPQVRYNKVVERLHRYEELLRECARARSGGVLGRWRALWRVVSEVLGCGFWSGAGFMGG